VFPLTQDSTHSGPRCTWPASNTGLFNDLRHSSSLLTPSPIYSK
jgi:hypothetical protein